jgi:hypothetical protein
MAVNAARHEAKRQRQDHKRERNAAEEELRGRFSENSWSGLRIIS